MTKEELEEKLNKYQEVHWWLEGMKDALGPIILQKANEYAREFDCNYNPHRQYNTVDISQIHLTRETFWVRHVDICDEGWNRMLDVPTRVLYTPLEELLEERRQEELEKKLKFQREQEEHRKRRSAEFAAQERAEYERLKAKYG